MMKRTQMTPHAVKEFAMLRPIWLIVPVLALVISACGGGGGGGGGAGGGTGAEKPPKAKNFPAITVTGFGMRGTTTVNATVTLIDGGTTITDTDGGAQSFRLLLTPTADAGGNFDELPTLRIVGSSTENIPVGLSGD